MASASPRLLVASDHAAVAAKAVVLDELRLAGVSARDLGPDGPASVDYPDYAERLARDVAAGVADLGIFHIVGQPNLNIRIDREKAARYGLNSGDITALVQAAMGGAAATTVLEADRQFGVSVRLMGRYRDSVDAIGDVKVAYAAPGGSNAYVPLRAIADISIDTGASFVYRESSQRFIPIKFSIRGRDLGSTVAEAQARIAEKIGLPTGYRILWAGEFENLQKAKQRLEIIVPITLLLIVVLMPRGVVPLLTQGRQRLRSWIAEGDT